MNGFVVTNLKELLVLIGTHMLLITQYFNCLQYVFFAVFCLFTPNQLNGGLYFSEVIEQTVPK